MRELARRRSAGPGGVSNAASIRRGEAVPGLLPVDVPGRRGDRAGGGGQEGQGDLRHGPGHAQALLPRLLRRGEPHPPVPAAACSCNQRAESKGSIRNRT